MDINLETFKLKNLTQKNIIFPMGDFYAAYFLAGQTADIDIFCSLFKL